jgi:hypothetical protein
MRLNSSPASHLETRCAQLGSADVTAVPAASPKTAPADILNGHRIDLAEQNLEELASGPSTFIAVTELGSLAA